jgi:hypothetical protein
MAVSAESDAQSGSSGVEGKLKKPTVRRDIQGNLPYLPSPGTLKTVLDRIIDAHRPDRFNADFLENVLNLKGGSGRASIGLLKKMSFLNGDSSPTDLYAKFKTAGGRSNAAYLGLRSAYPEVFRKSEYAHTANEAKLNDIVVEITGLQKTDPIARHIKNTFNTIRSYITEDVKAEQAAEPELQDIQPLPGSRSAHSESQVSSGNGIRLSYNINIVLPETSDLAVLNAIFRSLKDNLLR